MSTWRPGQAHGGHCLPCCLGQSLPGACRLIARLLTGLWERCPTGDLGTGLGCGSGSYGHHVRRLSVRLSVGGSGSRPGAAPGRVGKGLMLCCLFSHACPQVTRISTSTARLCKGGLGRRRGAPHGTARTDEAGEQALL